MEDNRSRFSLTSFLLGVIIVLLFLFLTGAKTGYQIGRYQLSTVERRGFAELYVIDTTSGAVKFVDTKYENVPFEKVN